MSGVGGGGVVLCGGVVYSVTTQRRDVETFTVRAAAVSADPARLTAALSALLSSPLLSSTPAWSWTLHHLHQPIENRLNQRQKAIF